MFMTPVGRERSSRANCNGEEKEFCRLCLSACSFSSTSNNPVISPCSCKGTAAYIHVSCLEKWQDSVYPPSRGLNCTVCKSRIKHTNWKLIAKMYLGSKIVSFCTTIATMSWVLYTLFLMIPVRAFLQISLVVLSNWLPKEGIEIDDTWQLKWVGPQSSRRLALVQKANMDKSSVNDLLSIKPGCILLAANTEQHTSSYFFSHKSVILITKHSATEGTEGILVSGRSLQLARDGSSSYGDNSQKENYLSVLFTIEDGGPSSNGYKILHNNDRVSGTVCLIEGGLYMSDVGEVNGEQMKVGQEDVRRFKTLVDVIDTHVAGMQSRKKRIFQNICAWQPGQLESEIQDGNLWYVINNVEEKKCKIANHILSSHKNLYDKLINEVQFENDEHEVRGENQFMTPSTVVARS